ncbi:centrosomal P4.1-associated protein [Rhinophrynus dorsalis]
MPEMTSSADFTSETSFMAQYTPSISRAGVILNPTFPSLETETDYSVLRSSNSIPGFRVPLNFSSSASLISEDSLEENEDTCVEAQDAYVKSDQITAFHLASEGHMITYGDPVVEWEHNQIRNTFMEIDASRKDLDDPLLKKLEQLKVLQQQKQEQLKQQQMEQLQKLMEEQKMLLSMVSRKSAYSDKNVSEEGKADDLSHYDDSTNPSPDEQHSFLQQLKENNEEITCTEERPIVSGIKGRKKSFEELLEEQLRLEERRLGQNDRQQAQDVIVSTKAEKLQTQRKIAPVGKEQISAVGTDKSNQTGRGKSTPVLKKSVLKNNNANSPPIHGPQETKLIENCKGPIIGGKSCSENKENLDVNMLNEANRKGNTASQKMIAMTYANCTSKAKHEELSFEVSFQNRKINYEKEKQKENFELDEFLLLEQAAEDISFSSNSSFVQKLLHQDYETYNGHRRLSSTPVKLAQQQQDKKMSNIADSNNLIQRRKERGMALKSIAGVSSDSTNEQYDKSTGKILEPPDRGLKIVNIAEKVVDDMSEDDSTPSVTDDTKESAVSSREDDPLSEDCKEPCKNVNKDTKGRDFDLDLSEGEDYNDDESTLLERKNNDDDDHNSSLSSNKSQIEFDDERTWADLEDAGNLQNIAEKNIAVKQFIQSSPEPVPDKIIKRKVASMKGDDLPRTAVSVDNLSPPPASNLMMKLFPSLKPKPKPESQVASKSTSDQEDGGDTIRSQLLREKLVELETEIERFKMENAKLSKLGKDKEAALEALRKEATDFELHKAKELARIEEFKKEEIKKLQKERKVFEKYASAARAGPDKKEREEIQTLKQQLSDLQEELKRKEAKWSTTHSRLRNQIETLLKENAELKDEIKFIEKVRLESWKKAEAADGKKKLSESHNVHLRRSESLSLRDTSRKIQNQSLAPQPEKSTKVLRRSQSPPKGKGTKNYKPGPVSSSVCNSEKPKANKTKTEEIALQSSDNMVSTEQIEQIPFVKGREEAIHGEVSYSDGKIERILRNGCHVILFPNGTRKEVSSDGKSTTVTFFNGDVKQVMADQRVIYYYADAQTTHTTYPDGLEILQFSNGQIEKHFPDGKKEITFPDQTIKNLYTDGREESIFPDGTIITVHPDGSKVIEFDNGQREFHTTQFKRREYPDGTVKTVYTNGQQETKYASGRIRIKDKDGNIIMDTKIE